MPADESGGIAGKDLSPPVSDADHIAGPADPPVTLLEFGDFQCRRSGDAYLVVKRLQEAIPELRFAYRHFPVVSKHPRAVPAAEASEAAAAQSRFWQYHDMLYRDQGELEDSDLVRYAEKTGLDVERFRREVASRTYRPKVADDRFSGEESGVKGTPTFFINGRPYDGPVEFRILFEILIKVMRAVK
jgi:protein-disulfide isomerase